MKNLTISKISKDMTIASILESQPNKAMKLSEIREGEWAVSSSSPNITGYKVLN